MRILLTDTFTCYPLGIAGGHRSNHTQLLRLQERPGVQCMAMVAKTAIGTPRPEYFPKPRDFATLGIREFRDEGDRWFFDCGYPIWAVPDLEPALAAACEEFRPSVLLTSSADPGMFVRVGQEHGIPVICHVRDVRFQPDAMRALAAAGGRLLACSHYMASWVEREAGVRPEVFYPAVAGEHYQAERDPGGSITFINPVPLKGFEVFLEILPLLPDERFLVVESWPLNDSFEAVRSTLASFPNVRFLPRLPDIREVYRQTRLLLVPSKFEEPAGRVVVEAQHCGIPVLVSARGGLPEMVGEGGLVVQSPSDPQSWVEAIRRAQEPGEMEHLSRRAFENAQRPDFSPDCLTDRLLALCREVTGGSAG